MIIERGGRLYNAYSGPVSEKEAEWLDRSTILAVVVALMLMFVGCATPNTGQCPPEYRSTELRNEGKLVLWCLR